jgi:hypothetical protein
MRHPFSSTPPYELMEGSAHDTGVIQYHIYCTYRENINDSNNKPDFTRGAVFDIMALVPEKVNTRP